MTFGGTLAEARKNAEMSQKDLAAKIKKEDGEAFSPQYLNDIEHDRRNPPSGGIIKQIAKVLKIPPEVLLYQAGELDPAAKGLRADDEAVVSAYKAFREELRGKEK